jgi:polyisoprenoid-binding protein YceI
MSITRTFRVAAAVTALVLGLASATAEAGTLRLAGVPKVSFFAKGSPGALDIEGKTSTLVFTDDGTTLTFKVPMATVKTGIELRDQHMRDNYVEVAKYPEVTLTFPKADVKWPAAEGEETTGTITGSFTAHGATQPIEITYTVKSGKKGLAVEAGFPYDVTQYGIAIPSYLGVTIDPAQRAEVKILLLDGQ